MRAEDVDLVKQQITDNSIKQDQAVIVAQWTKTLLNNDPDCAAIRLAQLCISMLAKGDLKIRTTEKGQLSDPDEAFILLDYLSHSSRIIVDYAYLNSTYADELLAFFDPNQDGIEPRTSTHATSRIDGEIIEKKGFFLGAQGSAWLPVIAAAENMGVDASHYSSNFGVNIAMGGAGNSDFYNGMIDSSGKSGHLFFNHNRVHQLLMIGLEQSKPNVTARTVQNAFNNASKFVKSTLGLPSSSLNRSKSEEFSNDEHVSSEAHAKRIIDQFGQGHSIIGASDTYTAAGSLYFSNTIYQAKMLDEFGILTPLKYTGMILTLNNINWPEIKAFLSDLISITNTGQLIPLLSSKPKSVSHPPDAHKKEENIIYFFDSNLDNFTSYMNQLKTIFLPIETKGFYKTHDYFYEEITKTNQLIRSWRRLQNIDINLCASWVHFKENIQLRINHSYQEEPKEGNNYMGYTNGINRLIHLFDMELSILIKRARDEMVNKLASSQVVLNDLNILNAIFNQYQFENTSHDYMHLQEIHHQLNSSRSLCSNLLEGIGISEEDGYVDAGSHSILGALAKLNKAEIDACKLLCSDPKNNMLIQQAKEIAKYNVTSPCRFFESSPSSNKKIRMTGDFDEPLTDLKTPNHEGASFANHSEPRAPTIRSRLG